MDQSDTSLDVPALPCLPDFIGPIKNLLPLPGLRRFGRHGYDHGRRPLHVRAQALPLQLASIYPAEPGGLRG